MPIIHMEPVAVSTQLDSIGHDATTNTLAVRFKPNKTQAAAGEPGSLYHYPAVTAEQFAEGKATPSFNSWFIRNVKAFPDLHPHKKIDESAEPAAQADPGLSTLTTI